MHSKPTADRSRLGQLILILVLDPLLHDLPTALAPIRQRCVKLLINLLGGLTVTVPPVLLAGPTTRPTRTPRRLPARERRRLTLGRTPRLSPSSFATRARKCPFSPTSRAASPHSNSFSADNSAQRAAKRANSSTGSAGSTSTSDAGTATTATEFAKGYITPTQPAKSIRSGFLGQEEAARGRNLRALAAAVGDRQV
jgi:hypothetical protein